MSKAVDILMRLRGGRSAAHETRQVGDELGRLGRKARVSGEQAHKSGKAYEYATQRLRLFGHAAVGVREHTLGLASAALGVSAGIFGLEHVVASSVQAWGEQRRILAQTGAVLKSTGGAAGVTAGDVEHLSERLSRLTGIQADQISQAQNMLLTFRNVRGGVFTESTKAAVDMAAAFQSAGKSMTLGESALQLGKALNDPAKGMTRLQRIGVTFTKSQQDQIKALTAFGDRVGAQKVILRELNKEFGGSAAAVATPGTKLRATVHQIEETFGKGLQPAIDAVDTKLLHLADKALPYVTRAANDVSNIFNRKDLNLGQKLALAAKVSKRDLKPLFKQIEQGIKSWHPAQKVEAAASWAISHLATGFGKGAPLVVTAFVKGFMGATVWGKIAALGFLFWKFSALRSVGTKAAAALTEGMVARLAATETGVAIAASLGTGVASTGALTLLSRAGKFLGYALGAAAAIEIGLQLTKALDPQIHAVAQKLADIITGTNGAKNKAFVNKQAGINKGTIKHPVGSGAPPEQILGTNLVRRPGQKRFHHSTPPLHPSTSVGELPKPRRHTSGFRIDSPHPSLAGVLRIDNHHHIYVDGKEMTAVLAPNLTKGDNPKWVSEAVGKQVANRKARR